MISVDYIINALEYFKVGLPFFDTPCIKSTKGEIAKNGGQIAQTWLKSEGIDTTRFKRKHNGNDDDRIRRKKLRGQGERLLLQHHKVLIK